MARKLLFYTSYKYNKRLVITSSNYLYRLFKYKDISYEYSKEPIITSSEYLYRPSSANIDHLYLKGR